MEHTSIPIIFGITGHRDLRPEDIASLKKSVHDILETYKNKYPNTEIILLSALAEGADMLAAEVAMDLGITLKIILPYEEKAYLQSFENQQKAIQCYKDYKKYAFGDPHTLSCEHNHVVDCYQTLGEYIADTSNILIALYDGGDTNKKGGTASIVKYTRYGLIDSLFDPLDGESIFIINTPRKSNPKISNPFQVKKEFLGMMSEKDFHEMLEKVDELNHETAHKISNREEPTILEKYHNHFDEQANKNQRKYKRHMVIILVLTWLAIVFLELMHNLNGVEKFKPWAGHLIIVYAVGLIAAFLVYRSFMKKGKLQDDFVFSRAISESIRVQNTWNSIGYRKSVSKYYLANQPNKFTWIRVVLKNLYFLHESSSIDKTKAPYESSQDWIDGQIEYFKNNIPSRKSSIHIIHKIEKPLFIFGVVALFAMFGVYLLETFHVIHHGHFPLNWHFLVLVSGLFLLSAGFLNKYSRIEGHQEDLYNYQIMEPNFLKSKELLSENTNESFQKKVIIDLGKKALEENSKWVELHDARRAKPELE